MSLRIRKVVVLVLLASVLLLANLWIVVQWLADRGVVDLARHIRGEYLTGTAVTIIVVLLILLVGPRAAGRWMRRCPVCDHALPGNAKYCSECGSRA